MKHITPNSFMPVMITAITSILFLEKYDSVYVINMMTGLILFFYFAECVRRVATALKTRDIHHYAIPRAAILLYTPSLIVLTLARFAHEPQEPVGFFVAVIALIFSMVLLWVLIWGMSRFINRAIASHRLFLPTIHHGLNVLALLTPIFYPISAIRSELPRTALSYNPLAIATIATRTALLSNYTNLHFHTIVFFVLTTTTIGCAGYFHKKT